MCNHMLFIIDGIAAPETIYEDKQVINRFFQKGDACTSISNAIKHITSSDKVVSVTSVTLFSLPYNMFYEIYHRDTTLGCFIRNKVIEEIVDSKEISAIKSLYKDNELDLNLRKNIQN